MYYPSAVIHRFECGQALAFKAQIGIRVILKDDQIMGFGQADKLPAPFKAEGKPGRILEIGNHVNAFDTFTGRLQALDFMTQTIWIQPIAVYRDTDDFAAPGANGPGAAKVGRKPDDNHIFPVDKNLGSQMHALGRSMGNDQVVGAASVSPSVFIRCASTCLKSSRPSVEPYWSI